MPEEEYTGSWHNEAAKVIEALDSRAQVQRDMSLVIEALNCLTAALGALGERVQDIETRQSPERWMGTDNLPNGEGTWP